MNEPPTTGGFNEPIVSVRDQKNAQRKAAEALRKASKLANPQSAQQLCEQFYHHITLPTQSVVASYMAKGSEIDPVILDTKLAADGHQICLPVVIGKHHPLAFRLYRHGDSLVNGMFDIPEPLAAAPIGVPTVMLIPMLAFDLHGKRLGYGGGFYDRSISLLRRESKLLAIGIAFAAQELPEVAAGPNDAILDWIVTEKGAKQYR